MLTTDPRGRALLRHPLAVPVAAAVLLFLIGAHVACVFKIPSWGNDEPAHLGYVATLASGELPTIDAPIMADPEEFSTLAGSITGWDAAHNDIWTANHPPAFHLLVTPIWWLASDDPGAAVVAMRLVNTTGFALWLLLVGLIARELVPRRPAAAALATVVALTPTLALRSGFLQNDGVGSAAALLVTLMTVRMLRDRITPDRLAVAALAGTVAAGTRAPGVLLVVLCTAAVLAAGVRRHGWRRGLAAGAAVSAVPAAATGWFYLRNLRLYGDLTGQDALLAKFERSPAGLQDVLELHSLREFVLATPIPLLVGLLVGPLVVAEAVRRRRARPDPAWLLLAVHAGVTLVNVALFIAAGGGFHDRYLMQVMPLFATVTALAMLRVGAWRRRGALTESQQWRVATVWTGVLLVWLAAAVVALEWYYIFGRENRSPVEGALPPVVAGAAVVAGLVVLLAMAQRARHPVEPVPGAVQLSAEPLR